MSLILDASVAVKWVLDELGSPRARDLRQGGHELTAPCLILAEVGSAFWKRTRREAMSRAEALRGIGLISAALDRLVPLDGLQERALELAFGLNHPIYDCFYLALAERERAPLITADRKLIAAAERLKTVETQSLT